MVVLDKQVYLDEANRQLKDDRFYKKLDSDPTEEFSALITDTLDEMYENDEIGVSVYETQPTVDRVNFICFQKSIRNECLDAL